MIKRTWLWRLAACLSTWIGLAGLGVAQELPAGWASRPFEGGVLYEATGLRSGAALNVWAPPPSKVGSADLMLAFEQVRREGLRGFDTNGMTPQCKDAQSTAQGGLTQSCHIAGAGRAPMNLELVLLPLHDGQAGWLRVMTVGDATALAGTQDGFGKVLTIAIRRVATGSGLAKAMGAGAGDTRGGSNAGGDGGGSDPQSRADAPAKAAPMAAITAPGAGLKPNEYEMVLFSWNQIFGYHEKIYLLFKDGTAFEGLEVSPQDFNVEAARRLKPQQWVQWRKSGKKYSILRPNSTVWNELQAWPATPGRANERLANTFTNYWSTGSVGLGGATSVSGYTLKPDGRFEEFGTMSMGTGSMQAANGFNSSSVSTYNGSGSRSAGSVSATGGTQYDAPVAGGGSSSRRNDGSSHTGTYRIDGWGIELRRDNGVVEHRLFLYTTDERRDINIGGVHYGVPSKK